MATAHISGESLTAYQLRCNVCKQIACENNTVCKIELSDSKMLVTLSEYFLRRVKTRSYTEGTKRPMFDEWEKCEKISCAYCGFDWGITCRRGMLYLPVLRLNNFVLTTRPHDYIKTLTTLRLDQLPSKPEILNNGALEKLDTEKLSVNNCQSSMDVQEILSPSSRTFNILGSKVHLPNDIFPLLPSSEQYRIQIDPVVMCYFLTKSGDVAKGEDIVAAPIEIRVSEIADDALFNGFIEVTLQHVAHNVNNVQVYTAKHRGQIKKFTRLQNRTTYNDANHQESFFHIDDTHVYIFLRKPPLTIVCTEIKRGLDKPKEFTIDVYTKVSRNKVVAIDGFVYDHKEITEPYLKRFEQLQERMGMSLLKSAVVRSMEPVQDWLEVRAVESECWMHSDSEADCHQQWKVQDLFCLQESRGPCLKVICPQQLAKYDIKPTDMSSQVLSLCLSISTSGPGGTSSQLKNITLQVQLQSSSEM